MFSALQLYWCLGAKAPGLTIYFVNATRIFTKFSWCDHKPFVKNIPLVNFASNLTLCFYIRWQFRFALIQIILVHNCMHCYDVKWPPWRLELPVCRVFVQQFVQTDNKNHQKSALLSPCEGNPLVNSPHKGAVTGKMCLCNDVTMEHVTQVNIQWLKVAVAFVVNWPLFGYSYYIIK